ncbi:hypothetical protein Nocox_32870 [Nonomuraea coxensis DSM 45129]|uniref:Toxin-antitoxin system HicB family antitoxin n=1 Tax=Nonomuraea coxensis DSM 45129 TaxID=1122611 RepID=A0ABX8U9E1_9ACTN|nr:hypothetical protein [Nonomuraea coxensis]QYC44145.1 hypothetical protein Nocox_32870 [Nonomuraea coxensis DSM 45129]
MDLAPYVDRLRRELAVAAGAGGEDVRALAERLSAALEPAARLALLEALSAAADEITRDLAPGSVEVRLRGRDPDFVVTPPPGGGGPYEEDGDLARPPAPPVTPAPPDADEGGTSRISLRVPEHLKPRIEEAAGREGLSVNAWLVRAVAAALDAGEPGRRPGRPGRPPQPQPGRRYSGWVS